MAMKDDDEPEDKENGEGESEEGNKGGKKKLIIIILAAVLLLGGGGAGLYFSGMLGGKKDAAEEESAEAAPESDEAAGEETKGADGKGAKKAKAGMPTFYELPEFLVNLNTDGKGLSFIKMTVVLELAGQKDSEQISALQPRVVNDFNTYLRELRASDLAGSTGLERLREELLMRVNKSVSPIQVSDILFKEIIVQ